MAQRFPVFQPICMPTLPFSLGPVRLSPSLFFLSCSSLNWLCGYGLYNLVDLVFDPIASFVGNLLTPPEPVGCCFLSMEAWSRLHRWHDASSRTFSLWRNSRLTVSVARVHSTRCVTMRSSFASRRARGRSTSTGWRRTLAHRLTSLSGSISRAWRCRKSRYRTCIRSGIEPESHFWRETRFRAAGAGDFPGVGFWAQIFRADLLSIKTVSGAKGRWCRWCG